MSLEVWLPTGDRWSPFVDRLRPALAENVELLTSEELPAGADPRVLVRGVPTREQVEGCPKLERFVIPFAGLPAATRKLMRDYPHVRVHNLHHNAPPVAELAVGLLLALAKQVVPFDKALRGGDWRLRYAEPTTTTLAGRTALVLGYGATGRRVAHALKALGMRVHAIRRHAPEVQIDQGVEIRDPAALHSLLPQADALVLCLPLTPVTTALIGETEIALLPRSAYVVNVGRADLVAESALYEALRDGRLGGAGLDVWYRYPKSEEERASTPPANFPFAELDNVVLSPHRAGLTRETELLRAQALANLLNAAASGDVVDNVVDLEAGY
jgi:phosphoglycerate dehydrogenase-like enzyme